MPSSNPLPPKENALFKRILKCYEHKQYKNGLKFAKQILSHQKFAEHGETLAMKGLTLNCLGRKEEANDLVKRGLRNDLKSHVCWHVYGLLQRSDKKYDEAIKCYRNALKWEKDNIQILRDLSLLQIQMRDLEGYRDTRYQLFMLRPTQRASWIGFAMSYHLLKDYDMALKILESFRKTLITGVIDYEHSELLLYQNLVIQESGRYEEALNHLEECRLQICDKLSIEETFASLYLSLDREYEAEEMCRCLINRNPENTNYYEMLFKARHLDKDKKKLRLLYELQQLYPKSLTIRRLILDFAYSVHPKIFEKEIKEFLKNGIRKGVPPLFVQVRALCEDDNMRDIILQVMLSFVENLTAQGTLEKVETNEVQNELEAPSVLLWTYYFLAQYYDYVGETETALYYIVNAINHTPTLIELFIAKGRIYKHAGDAFEASKWMDEAQALDSSDRYVNSKCAKYMLRANRVKEAEEICSKFTREGVTAMENLNEMQCMWFQTECALAYRRLENWGESLKKCHEIDRHFSEIIEDQFDFHTYCLRKMTLRSYVGLLRLEDVLRSHSFFRKAANCAISVYLHLYDKPLCDSKNEKEIYSDALPANELKKIRNKQRKAQKKAALQQAEDRAAAEKKELHKKATQSTTDQEFDSLPQDELIPEKLARTSDPLEQAMKFLKPLQNLDSQHIDTHIMAYEIYYRKNKVLLMLQSVKRAYNIDPDYPLSHTLIIRFMSYFELMKTQKKLLEPVCTVISRQMEPILCGKSLQDINEEYLSRNSHSYPAVIQSAIMMYFLDPSTQERAIQLATDFSKFKRKNIPIDNCQFVLNGLKCGDFGATDKDPVLSASRTYEIQCHKYFSFATAFRPDGWINPYLTDTQTTLTGIEIEQTTESNFYN